jgi:hypothetical protein
MEKHLLEEVNPLNEFHLPRGFSLYSWAQRIPNQKKKTYLSTKGVEDTFIS